MKKHFSKKINKIKGVFHHNYFRFTERHGAIVDTASETKLNTFDRKSLKEIKDFIMKYQTESSKWIVGCSNDPQLSLFSYHNVLEKGGKWIYKKFSSTIIICDIFKMLEFNLKIIISIDIKRKAGALYVYAFEETVYTFPNPMRSFLKGF